MPNSRDKLSTEGLIRLVSGEVQKQLDELYRRAGNPEPGSALDQVGLRDGASIVEDYLTHGELGVAFDHLIYMIEEPDVELSDHTYQSLVRAGEALGLPPHRWGKIRRSESR